MTLKVLSRKACLGFVGLGSIGLPIAANLIAQGFSLQVHTRSRLGESDKRLKGSKSCSSPREAAEGSDAFLICVSDDEALETVLFGPEGAEASLKEGAIVIDLSTISPSKAKSCAIRLGKRSITYLDAPVTGGTEGAINGSLTIFLGGDEDSLNSIREILDPIASYIYTFGSVGKGQEVKSINQILVAGSYIAVAEAIALGQKLGLPMEIVVEALQNGAASSWALKHRSRAMLTDKYPLGFKLHLHHKDLCIALKAAEEVGLDLPITTKVREIEKALISKGHENEDIAVLRRSIREIDLSKTNEETKEEIL